MPVLVKITFFLLLSTFVMAAPKKEMIEGVTYQILRVSPHKILFIWKGDDGQPLRTFPAASTFLKAKGIAVETLMNGGIFEPGGIPSGLLVQDGKEMNPVNRNKGEGNFFLQPNGIFLISETGAAVISTDEYPQKNVIVRQAVQSGPLLLRGGKIHPAFNANSESKLHRNGVGVAKTGEVIFVMTDFHSEKFVNLHQFAQLFKTLGCDDALFLDGDISQMRSGADMEKQSNSFGSILAVVKDEK
ncbi:MAG: phosphodiester glycosidase family protein [Verrucomicrobiota bacterium]